MPGLNGRLQDVPEAARRMALTSENEDGAWTAELSATARDGTVSAVVFFTGPANKTRRMGMCLAQQYDAAAGVTCSTGEDCGSAPETLHAGGARYCIAPQDSTTRTCHLRPGAAETYCVGSPAVGYAAIAPGAYRLDITPPAGTQWLAFACFEGCTEIPPLTSQTLTVR